jgi:superfamily II DNA/RNA helicase
MKQPPDSSDSSQDEDPPPVEHIYSNIAFEQDFEVRDELLNELNDRLEAAPVEVQAPLAAFVPKADEYQQPVIDSSAHTLRVVAPPGSGKTQTMLNRVLRRIQQGSHPERLLLLTFDNAAASSLTTKLRQQTEQLGVELRSLQIKLSVVSTPQLR